jgi:O-antigen ligase
MRHSATNVGAAQFARRNQPTPSELTARLSQVTAQVRKEPMGPALFVVTALWLALLFDPHWYLAAKGPDIILKLPVVLFVALIAALGLGMLTGAKWRHRWQWGMPFLALVLVAAIAAPFAINVGYARDTTQGYLLWWALIVGTAAIVDSPRRAEFFVYLYGIQFLWWAMWGGRTGLVFWHHALSNYDGFGAFNVGGVGICYFLALSAHKQWFKWLMYMTAGLCAMGVVASFARGAFLALVVLYAVIWLRSPHKGKTAMWGVGAVIVVMLAATLLFEEGFFWNEIKSAFEEGHTEGTGAQRWQLWTTAIRVWENNPIIGVGLKNYGVAASMLYQPGELEGMFANPGALYDYVLHNLYLTTLSELGILGCIALIWIFIDFFKRNAQLRSEAAERRWHELGGRMKLRPIALGLEAAMIAFMVDAAMYSMMGLHWFYTMLAMNLTLHAVAVRWNRTGVNGHSVQRGRTRLPNPGSPRI